MVHPNVLREGGVDPNVYQGFAFGFGLTRLVMLKYGIDDIRNLQSGDIRFLKQF
jgi:phenylalanyl-tRNA synthetase alpha chain